MPTPLFEPAQLGPIRLRNRIIKAATFEGMSRKGLVTPELIDFHRTFAAGGVGMTTVAYCAVTSDGRGAPNEIVLRPEARDGLAELAAAVHAEGAAVSAQVGHAGPVGNSRVTRSRALSASSGRSPLGSKHYAMNQSDIDRVVGSFASGAAILADAGFDAVEIHMGHHYLLNAFLSPRFNRRHDSYGGTVEKRAKLLRDVAAAVRAAVGNKIAVIAKWEMLDGVRRGLNLRESLEAAALLESDGTVDALELTGGGSLANPMFLFRGEVPRAEFAANLTPAQRAGFRVVGRWFMRDYPFEEAYFRPQAREFLGALRMPLVLLGGINRVDTMQDAVREGFQFVALGRALLREPDLVRRLEAGETQSSACIHCNKCMPTIYRGTHCVLVEPAARPGQRAVA